MARAADYASLSYLTLGNLLKFGNLKDACLCTLCTDSYSGVTVKKIYRGVVFGVIFKDDYRKEIILTIKGTTTNTEWLLILILLLFHIILLAEVKMVEVAVLIKVL